MDINEKKYGFTVTKIREESVGEFIEMRHDKTGAQLAWLNNGEENKLFSVSFKTVPGDDTGVFHILEHSVLGGSKSYPVKDPFLYLLKSSMNTFLNAMTFPDKTMFPVASRNNTDFMNLTRVYLDAVFKPSIYDEPNIFYQEGCHIEWKGSGEPAYKGVVFNEMKGAVSSVDERIDEEILRMLFPDSCYRFVSGGLPEAIPDLKYEDFIEAHCRFYHPSNSYFYLDGDVNIDEILGLIDEYLCEYEADLNQPEIKMQTPVKTAEKAAYYEISPDESEENRTHLAMGKIIASWDEREKIYAYSVLCEALAGSNDAPFSRAMLDTGLCLDVSLDISDGIQQPYGVLTISNINCENGGKLIEAVKSTVSGLVDNGIGKDNIISAINRCEFRFRESEEPKAIIRSMDAMSSWLYGGDPLYYIECGSLFDDLREKAETDYFEKLLAEWLLDENGRALVYMLPSRNLGEESRIRERAKLDAALAEMNETEKNSLAELNKNLEKWQHTPDSAESVDALPKLPISEVSGEPVEFKTEVEEKIGYTLLRHSAKDSFISAMNLYFDISDLTDDELRTAVFMDRLIAELPTSKSSGAELQKRITGILGSLSSDISAIGDNSAHDECRTFFVIKSRFLTRNFDEAQKLIGELITETDYTSAELIGEILMQDDEDMKQEIISDGHLFASRRVRGSMSAESAVKEIVSGFEGYKSLHEFIGNMEERIPMLIEKLRKLSKRIFCKNRLTASVTSVSEISPDIIAAILPVGEKFEPATMKLSLELPKAQGIIISSGVSYSAQILGAPIVDMGLWNVLTTLLSYEYLWNEVRVKGGAYGTGAGVNSLGEVVFHSYRDPSPSASIEIYNRAVQFLEAFCRSDEDLSRFIISSIARGEPMMSDGEYGSNCDNMYFRGITQEKRREIRQRMLSLTKNDLAAGVEFLKNTGNCCIVGAKNAVEAYGGDMVVESVK